MGVPDELYEKCRLLLGAAFCYARGVEDKENHRLVLTVRRLSPTSDLPGCAAVNACDEKSAFDVLIIDPTEKLSRYYSCSMHVGDLIKGLA